MTKVIIEDLDPIVVEKLEQQADRHGRSLQAELKEILLLAISDHSSTNESNSATQVDREHLTNAMGKYTQARLR